MRKNGILNSKLMEVITSMGHTDKLIICDAGLPIPREALKIDLALINNVPRFEDTLKAVLGEMQVDKAIIAKEMESESKDLYDKISILLSGICVEKISHENFKDYYNSTGNIVFLRTGEITSFANIILIAGVTF
jgi:D-ribose pyranase